MENISLKNHLSKLLDKLRVNKEKVGLQELKTTYKKSYFELCNNISDTTEAYIKQISLNQYKISESNLYEVAERVDAVIKDSGLLKQISQAAFQRYDIEEITKLAYLLQNLIYETLSSEFDKIIKL